MTACSTNTAQPPVRGRLAPSPTGFLHLGNAWTFLLCWLAVRSQKGSLIVRIEDIDPERSRAHFVDELLRDLNWLGLDWDEGVDVGGAYAPYTQAERGERYAQVLDDLAQAGNAYPCFCTRQELRSIASAPHSHDSGPVYPGTCWKLSAAERSRRHAQGRKAAIRVHGEMETEFTDLLWGTVRYSWTQCGGDFPVQRSDGVISYQLAVAVDDVDQRVNMVVRGADLLPSTPRQLLLMRLIGATGPVYAHVPLVVDHNGTRLAKRHRTLELRALRAWGVSAAAVRGYLGFRAGLLAEPVPVMPHELVSLFSWSTVPRTAVVLPEDIGVILQALS